MTDYVWPNGLRMSSLTWRHKSNSEASDAEFSGGVQTSARPGDRLGCRVRVQNATGSEIGRLRALAAAMRGRGNRIFLQDLSHTGRRRGSFVSTELFSNTDFLSTTGWNGSAAGGSPAPTVSVSDQVLRATCNDYNTFGVYQAPSCTQYAPYALRAIQQMGRTNSTATYGISLTGSVVSSSDLGTSDGYRLCSLVSDALAFSAAYSHYCSGAGGFNRGDYLLAQFASLAPCMQADGAGNLWTYSDQFGNAAWTPSGATISSNTDVGPDGTTTMDSLVENAANSQHYVGQPFTLTSSAQDVMIAVVAAANTRNHIVLQMQENTGSTAVEQYFSLTGSGAVGANGSTGGNWANRRAFVKSLGNGRILCVLIARKTNAATSIGGYIMAASADGTKSYTGNSSSAVALVRGVTWPTSVPSRMTLSTSATVAASTQQGPNIYVKGLAASTTGLLLLGDQVEIDKQIKFVQASVDSDSTLNAYLQLDSPLARAVADNTPIIIEKPMAKFYMASDNEYEVRPGVVSDFEFDFLQDLNA